VRPTILLVGLVLGALLAGSQTGRCQDAIAEVGAAMQAASDAEDAGRLVDAEAAWLKAADLAEKAGIPKGAAFAWMRAGIVMAQQSKHQQAIALFSRALQVFTAAGMDKEAAGCHQTMGVSQDAIGRYDEAAASYQAAADLFEQLGLVDSQAECLADMALTEHNAGRYERAVELHLRALELYRGLGMKEMEAWVTRALGASYRALSRYDEAAQCYGTALALYTEIGKGPERAGCLQDLGIVETDRSHYAEAEDYLRQAMELFTAQGAEGSVARCKRDLGAVLHHLGRYDQAVAYYNEAAAVFTRLGLESDLAVCWQNLGPSHEALGQHEVAIEVLRRAMALNQKLGRELALADCALNLAVALSELAQYSASMWCFETALEVYTRRGKQRQQAGCWQGMGMVCASIGDAEKAVEYRERALAVYTELGLELDQAGCRLDLGVAHRALGHTEKAIEYYTQALQAFERLGLQRKQAGCLLNLGNACQDIKQHERSVEHLLRAEALLVGLAQAAVARGEQWLPEELYQVEASLGETYRARAGEGDAFRAYRYLARAIRMVEHLRGRAASTVEMRTSYFAKLTWVYDRIISLLLAMRERGVPVQPEQLDEQDPAFWSTLGLPTPDLWPDWATLEEATLHYNESTRARVLQEMLTNRELLFADPRTQALYTRWTSLVARLSNLGKSLTTALEAHDEALAQRLVAEMAQVSRERNEVERELFETAYGRVVQARPVPLSQVQAMLAPDEAVVEYKLLLDRVAAVVVTHAGLRLYQTSLTWGGDRPVWGAAERILAAGIEGRLGDLQQKAAERQRLPAGVPGVAREEDLLGALGVSELCWLFRRPMVLAGGSAEDRMAAQEMQPQQLRVASALYRLLLSPIEGQLAEEGIKGLIVVPDGALCYVPFAALVSRLPEDIDEAPSGYYYAAPGLQYAGERWRISYLPCVSMYLGMSALSAQRPQPQRRLCVLADPVFSSRDPRLGLALGLVETPEPQAEKLVRLPNTRQEAEQALAAFGGSAADICEDPTRIVWSENVGLLSRAAAEPAIHAEQVARYGYLLLSTHGVIKPDMPDFSHVALSCPEAMGVSAKDASAAEDGRLMLPEAFGLNLNAGMVTLSACRTAEGDFRSGEGILGLTAAMFVSGARAVTASVWSVSDEATASLIGRYHTLLAAGSAPASALQEAQMEVLATAREAAGREPPGEGAVRAEPFYWAPFVLQGQWR